MKRIPNNLAVTFNSEKEAKLIQLVAFKYGYNWRHMFKKSIFLHKCLQYLPTTSVISFENNQDIYYADLDYYEKYSTTYKIISFEEFIEKY